MDVCSRLKYYGLSTRIESQKSLLETKQAISSYYVLLRLQACVIGQQDNTSAIMHLDAGFFLIVLYDVQYLAPIAPINFSE